MLKTLKYSAVIAGLVSMVVLVVQPAVFGFIAYHFGIPLSTAIYYAGLIAAGSFLVLIFAPYLAGILSWLMVLIYSAGIGAAAAW